MTAISSDPLTELAALIVETDFLRSEADEHAMRAAREAERRAMEREVEAMHDAADAVKLQAWVSGGAALAGGTAQSISAVAQVGDDAATAVEVGLEKGGAAASSVAEPLGQLIGGVQKARADAHAAEARNASERADARADEAAEHRERVLRHTDSVLELVESTLDAQHQGSFAILGNF